MSKFHIYSPIIYDIALFQTLKRNYAVNGHEMYCTCVFFNMCVAHILARTVTELSNSKRFYDKKVTCFTLLSYCTVSNAKNIFL